MVYNIAVEKHYPKEVQLTMQRVRDGDPYRTIQLFGRRFDLKYGYYEDYERSRGEPVPIYPDFSKAPQYTQDGCPFVTQMQPLCRYGESDFPDGCCADCRYFQNGEELIGICLHANNRVKCTLEAENAENDKEKNNV